MIQKIYVGYVREIILRVYKAGVDMPDRKKIKKIKFKKHENKKAWNQHKIFFKKHDQKAWNQHKFL